jgi:hypothetical protein
MKKIIRLTESDLTRIVRRVLNEQSTEAKPEAYSRVAVDKLPKEFQQFLKTNGLSGFFVYGDSPEDNENRFEFDYVKELGANAKFGNITSQILGTINLDEIKTYEKYKGNSQKCSEKRQKRAELHNDYIKNPKKYGSYNKEKFNEYAKNELKKLYPNMEYCDVVNKMQRIIDSK